MKNFLRILYIAFSFIFFIYLAIPAPEFPSPPSDSVQSQEEADTEIPLKRAYFTNFTRAEVMKHYVKEFGASSFLSIPLPTYRLNYPPEDAQTLIRDQTRSTSLEEIVHPFRESFFVNGFEPKVAKDEIWYRGNHYLQKLTVKIYPSNVMVRLTIGAAALVLGYFVIIQFISSLKKKW